MYEPMGIEAWVVEITDDNDFGHLMCRRVFTERSLAEAWGPRQVEEVVRTLKESGEDLLDISWRAHPVLCDATHIWVGRVTRGGGFQ